MKQLKSYYLLFLMIWIVSVSCRVSQALDNLGNNNYPIASDDSESFLPTTYPLVTTPEGIDKYPPHGGEEPVPAASLSATTYPGAEQSNTPGSNGTLTATILSPTLISSSYPAVQTTPVLSAYPGPSTPTIDSTSTQPSFTPTKTGDISPTPGEITVTATYSITPAPTSSPTSTPVLPPPWVLSELKATDPQDVQIVSGSVQMIMFFAYWSGTSQAMAPIIHGIEAQYAERMGFVYLDIDDPATKPLQEEIGFEIPPHFFLLDASGEILESWQGYVSAEELIVAIESALEN